MKNLILSEYKEINATLIKLMLVAIFIVCVFYLYFVNITINAIIENRQDLKNFDRFSQEYQKLEVKYISLIKKIDIDYARLLGFIDQDKKTEYLTRQSIFARR